MSILGTIKAALTPASTYAARYNELLQQAQIRPEHIPELDIVISRIMAGRVRYAAVANGLNMPWWVVGIIHFMEAGIFYPRHFGYHLHCGDPLTARTVHVPKGRPVFNPHKGPNPPSATNPYTWEESATDALILSGWDKVSDWSTGAVMERLERFNGTGYRSKGILSPYIFSYTNLYTKGKYVLDGKFDPEAVSKQPGCAAIYLRMVGKSLI